MSNGHAAKSGGGCSTCARLGGLAFLCPLSRTQARLRLRDWTAIFWEFLSGTRLPLKNPAWAPRSGAVSGSGQAPRSTRAVLRPSPARVSGRPEARGSADAAHRQATTSAAAGDGGTMRTSDPAPWMPTRPRGSSRALGVGLEHRGHRANRPKFEPRRARPPTGMKRTCQRSVSSVRRGC
jgi:hypothetical protein